MKKEDVLKAIQTELDFVERGEKEGHKHIVKDIPLSSTLEAIRYNLDKANKEWYNEKDPYENTMDLIRKIAGLCIKAGVKYGMPKREDIS